MDVFQLNILPIIFLSIVFTVLAVLVCTQFIYIPKEKKKKSLYQENFLSGRVGRVFYERMLRVSFYDEFLIIKPGSEDFFSFNDYLLLPWEEIRKYSVGKNFWRKYVAIFYEWDGEEKEVRIYFRKLSKVLEILNKYVRS